MSKERPAEDQGTCIRSFMNLKPRLGEATLAQAGRGAAQALLTSRVQPAAGDPSLLVGRTAGAPAADEQSASAQAFHG